MRSFTSVLWLAWAGAMGMALAACTPSWSVTPRTTTPSVAAYEDDWHEGLRAFAEQDYPGAAAIFAHLRNHAGDEPTRRAALYAMACTRLIQAEKPADYRSALALWDEWCLQAREACSIEDPRMLTPLLEHLLSSFNGSLPADASSGDVAGVKGASPTPVKVVRDRECQKQLQEDEREIQRLRGQIKTLKQQIEALEAIHRKIQEKKKEVSSP
jgi:hypothetical protein